MLWLPRRKWRGPEIARIHISRARFTHRDARGRVIWEDELENHFHNEGEVLVLDMVFRDVNNFTSNWYGLLCGGTPSDSDTLSTLTGEPTGAGYARVSWTRGTSDFAACALNGTKEETAGVAKAFGPNTDVVAWSTVTTFVFATTADNSGKVLARFTLSAPRTVGVGENFTVQPTGRLYGVDS